MVEALSPVIPKATEEKLSKTEQASAEKGRGKIKIKSPVSRQVSFGGLSQAKGGGKGDMKARKCPPVSCFLDSRVTITYS